MQDSRNDFLAWDRVRNVAAQQITALVSLEDGDVREILTEVTPSGPSFSADGSYITYSTSTRTKTSYTRRDGTEYELFRLDLAEGSEPESLRDTGEERMSATWNEARDAFAYSERGSVFVRRLGEEEAVDVTAEHRGPADEGGGAEDEGAAGRGGAGGRTGGTDDPVEEDPDSTRIRFSVQRWSPSGNQLLLTSQDAWHLLDLATGDLRTLLELEDDDDTRPRRQVQSWSDDGRHLYFSYSARDRWQRGLKRLDTASGAIETLMLDNNLYRSWNISDDGSTIVYTMSDGDHP